MNRWASRNVPRSPSSYRTYKYTSNEQLNTTTHLTHLSISSIHPTLVLISFTTLSYTHSLTTHMTSSIKNYDFYRKAVDGLQTKSVVGGISTLYYTLFLIHSFHSICYSHIYSHILTTQILHIPQHIHTTRYSRYYGSPCSNIYRYWLPSTFL